VIPDIKTKRHIVQFAIDRRYMPTEIAGLWISHYMDRKQVPSFVQPYIGGDAEAIQLTWDWYSPVSTNPVASFINIEDRNDT
jgi:hypothetical protein